MEYSYNFIDIQSFRGMCHVYMKIIIKRANHLNLILLL